MESWPRHVPNMLTPKPLIIARIAPSIIAITMRAWFSIHSCPATAAGALAGIGTWRAPVARTNSHSAASTTPIVTTISTAVRSRSCPGSVASSQSSQAGRRRSGRGSSPKERVPGLNAVVRAVTRAR